MTAPAPLVVLERELDRMGQEGRTVDVWWRDDDAVADTPPLRRLLGIAARNRCPVALATIPAAAESSLVTLLGERPDVPILVHGLAHRNHAPADEKPAEFGSHRPVGIMAAEAAEGWRRTRDAFGTRALPVFVPPWNRIAPGLVPRLGALGFAAVSGFGRPALGSDHARPAVLDTHLDPVGWRGNRSLRPAGALSDAIRAAFAAPRGPVGFLTHHLVFDEALWDFCEGFAAVVGSHAAVRLRAVSDMTGREPDPPRSFGRRDALRERTLAETAT